MPKGRKNKSKCDRHNFLLKPITNNCYFSQVITASFCDQENSRSRLKKDQKGHEQCLKCPMFNTDRNYATPTFILQTEKSYFEEHNLKLKEQHEKKVQEYAQQKSQIWEPKPRSKNNYCSACRENYQDYLEHIRSPNHKKKIENSHFNKFILELACSFKKQNEKEGSKATNITSIDDSDLVEIIDMGSRPKKKVKRDELKLLNCDQNIEENRILCDNRYSSPQYMNSIYRPMNYNMNQGSNHYYSHFGMPMQNFGYNFSYHDKVPPGMVSSFPPMPPYLSLQQPFMRYSENPALISNQTEIQQLFPPTVELKFSSSQVHTTMLPFQNQQLQIFDPIIPANRVVSPKTECIVLDSD